jgi:hypothetical protein
MLDGNIISFPRHDAGGLTAVHTLVEDIDSGAVRILPTRRALRDMAADRPLLAEDLREDAQCIAASHKFDFSGWPSDSMVLSDVLKETGMEMLDAGLAQLPFPNVVFCRRSPAMPGIGVHEFVALLSYWHDFKNDSDASVIGCRAFQRVVDRTPWMFSGFTMIFPDRNDWEQWYDDPDGLLTDREQTTLIGMAYQLPVSGLAALSSRGPEVRTQPAPAKLNRQRARRGKLPIFEYHIVDIPRWAREKAEAQGGTHASPRLHWRRGHVRRLAAERKTLVRACLVGAAENGFINKDYAVR